VALCTRKIALYAERNFNQSGRKENIVPRYVVKKAKPFRLRKEDVNVQRQIESTKFALHAMKNSFRIYALHFKYIAVNNVVLKLIMLEPSEKEEPKNNGIFSENDIPK